MRKNNDLEKESNNLAIIVVLALFLICSLGYIAYDKYFSKLGEKEPQQEEKEETEEKTTYNKDGYFIKNLMEGIVYQSYIDHNEYQLYIQDKTTVDDLANYYKNTLLLRKIRKDAFTTEEVNKASKELFGKNIYDNYPDTIEAACNKYKLSGDQYTKQVPQGGCGGAGYRYYDMIKKVDTDDNHIYVYQVVGFSCKEGVCKDVEKDGDGFKESNVVKELDNPMDAVNMDELADQLHTYKFTFTYDSLNNIYYFESVEKEI